MGYDDFWTTQYAYQDMPSAAPDLVADLAQSGLVIFKGDLNYRKYVPLNLGPIQTSRFSQDKKLTAPKD